MGGEPGHERKGLLISCDPACRAVALAELAAVLPPGPGPEWLEEGLALVPAGIEFDGVAASIDGIAPIFVRHIAPVHREHPLVAGEADLEVLKGGATVLAGRLRAGGTFSVQTRVLGAGKLPYRRVVVSEALSTLLEPLTGARMDARTPDQVLTVVCTPTRGLLGVSRTAQNRSAWPGGMHRFKNEDGQVSRSEHKLLEAISVFGLELPAAGTALDMGAAPGGWTRVLRQRGLTVTAVDPADLDPALRRDPGVNHVRGQVQAFLGAGRTFDVVVNDMRMDAAESVGLMVIARAALKPGGVAVVTLKLPEEDEVSIRTLESVRGLVARLGKNYRLRGARRLYHNRSEVTVALQAA